MKLLKEWTKFEKILLFGSIIVISSVGLVLKSDLLTTFCSLLGIITVLLLAKGKNLGQVLGVLVTIMYSIVAYKNKYYGEVLINLLLMLPLYIIGIITSRMDIEYHELDNELEDIKDYIKIVVTSDLVESPKPYNDSMTYLCNKMNCTCDEVIYIGDSKSDMEFAKNSNCDFIPACWDNKVLVNEEKACLKPIDILKYL